jgi:hypothetical protein
MKLLLSLTGGYKRVMDRLLTLQSETRIFVNAQYAALGYDMVLSGCAITDNGNGTVNIAAGIIFIGGDSLRFDGAVNISADGSMAFVTGNPVTSLLSPFGDGSSKNIYSEIKAVIAAQDPTNIFQIKISTSLYNLQLYIQDQIYRSETKGTIKEVYDLDGTFRANFDSTGLGITRRWLGWALDNEENETPGSVGMATIAAGTYTDPVSGLETIYTAGIPIGERLHVLTPTETPTPAGIPPGLDGPRQKPEDGGGENIYYVNGPLKAAANAAAGHNNMQPSMPLYRVVKMI